jgi:hypothetical protein
MSNHIHPRVRDAILADFEASLLDDERRRVFCEAVSAAGVTTAEAGERFREAGVAMAAAIARQDGGRRTRDEGPGMTLDELLDDIDDVLER